MTEGGSSAQVYRGNIDKLIRKVNEARGIDLGLYRRAYLERRIAARLRTLDLHSYRQYTDLLDADPGEYERLLNTLTINVTEFFRDKAVWDSIRTNVMTPLIHAKTIGRSRTIRFWSAGCATGEEPYSLIMALLDLLGDDAPKYLISALCTDLDDKALEVAEKGIYETARLKRIPPSYQVRFTKRIDDSSFEVVQSVRRHARFRRSSLFDEPPMRVVDVILCRNVFIYFDKDQQAKVLEHFYSSLARGGYLILGRSEKLSPEAARMFEAVDGKERVYRKPAHL
jgi:chemotaxis protein methyltransferase CheR